MAFFGLGSFGTGFVEGLAGSANEALKKDISRINKKIDTISEFRVERAIKEQEERKAELEEVTKALKEGEALFAGHPRASEFAASMLQDSGSLAAFKSEVAQLRLDQRTKPRNLANFFELQETTNPVGSTLDYARAWQGAPKTDVDYKLPEGLAGEDKSLLGKLGFDIDISGRVQQQTQEMLGAMEIGKEQPVTFTLPSLKFKREDYNLSRMSASDRITFLNNERANPDNTPERNEQLDAKLDAALKFAAETRDIDTQIDANKQRLKLSEEGTEEYTSILNTLIDLNDQRDITDAKTSGNLENEYNVYIRQAIRNDKPDEAERLRRELNEKLGKGETGQEQVARLESEFQTKVLDGTLKEGTEEYNAALSELNSKKIKIRDLQLANVPLRDFLTAEKIIQDAIDDEVVRKLGLLPEDWKVIQTQAQGDGGIESLSDSQREVYSKAVGFMAEAETTVLAKYEQVFKFDPSMIKAINARREKIALAPESTGSTANTKTSSTVPTTGGTEAEVVPAPSDTAAAEAVTGDTQVPSEEDVTEEDLSPDELAELYPNTLGGSLEIIKDFNTMSPDMSELQMYKEISSLHGKEWAAATSYISTRVNQGGMGGLERSIAEKSIEGKDFNQIIMEIKDENPSYPRTDISNTVSRVLTEIQPSFIEDRIRSMELSGKLAEERKSKAAKLTSPMGLMSRQ